MHDSREYNEKRGAVHLLYCIIIPDRFRTLFHDTANQLVSGNLTSFQPQSVKRTTPKDDPKIPNPPTYIDRPSLLHVENDESGKMISARARAPSAPAVTRPQHSSSVSSPSSSSSTPESLRTGNDAGAQRCCLAVTLGACVRPAFSIRAQFVGSASTVPAAPAKISERRFLYDSVNRPIAHVEATAERAL